MRRNVLGSLCAVHISGQMIAYARTKTQDEGISNVRFLHANVRRGVEGGPFDKVMAFSLLHLVSDVSTVLQSAYDQSKPGGLVVSKTVCLEERNLGIRTMIKGMRAFRIPTDVTLLSQFVVRDHIHQAGFEIIEITYFGDQRMDPFIVARRHD